MKVYEVSMTRPWDGRETYSIHMTRKGALQVACAEGLEALIAFDDVGNEEDLTWVEDNLKTLLNPAHTLKTEELETIFQKCDELLWDVEMGIQVDEHTLQP
jgi:hypothetical protein